MRNYILSFLTTGLLMLIALSISMIIAAVLVDQTTVKETNGIYVMWTVGLFVTYLTVWATVAILSARESMKAKSGTTILLYNLDSMKYQDPLLSQEKTGNSHKHTIADLNKIMISLKKQKGKDDDDKP